MIFLVEMRQDGPMPDDSSDRGNLAQSVRRTLARLAEEPNVRGGVVAGARAIVFVVETATTDALDEMLQELPLWSKSDAVRVTPLVAFAARLAYDQRVEPGPPG